MDDVLPKPFTRKSLLDMLEKHLMHLKAVGLGMDPVPQPAMAPSVTHSSAAQSVGDASSPGQSPGGSLASWQSPGQFNGVSPIHTQMHNQYATMQNNSSYDQPNPNSQYHSPQTPMSARMPSQQFAQPHRRQVSEMAGGQEMDGSAKRQRLSQPQMATSRQ